MITIATNMAGRGTDIVLGGNVEKAIEARRGRRGIDPAAKASAIAEMRTQWTRTTSSWWPRGPAHHRHRAARVAPHRQPAARPLRPPGRPGSSRFYLSLDDPLMRIFAGDRVQGDHGPPEDARRRGDRGRHRHAAAIESAQRKVEGRNFDIRKQLLEYDDVANDQRKVIYQQRNDILDASDLTAQIAALREGCFTDLVHQYVPPESVEEQWDLPGLEKVLADEWGIELPLRQEVEAADRITDEDTGGDAWSPRRTRPSRPRWHRSARRTSRTFERMVLLQSIDSHWREHLAALDYLRQGIHLRGYAQKQPKQEYKREAFELFGQMLDAVKNEVTRC
jgi:preprotein translocase subunit SecA